MIARRGIIGAVEYQILKEGASPGFEALRKANMLDKAFESVVIRHPQAFSTKAVEKANARLEQFNAGN